jgi:type II secretory ATPase GspE/PulE/Tfp pilus assembly ATPase PilB-like protein
MHAEPIDFQEEQSAEETCRQLVAEAAKMGASDLLLLSDEREVTAAVRLLGIMTKLRSYPSEEGQRLIRYVKAASGMDLAERRRPLDGRWVSSLEDGSRADLRINTLPTVFGEDLCVRIMDTSAHRKQIEDLGLSEGQRQQLEPMLQSPSGLVLVTGPTGSGKSTTLYSCLEKLNDGQHKINTIEDPVEYRLAGVRQAQVSPLLDLGFAEILRAVLRQAPDVIMIGEIRDAETATTAVRAANSGHLVFATLHAPIAAAAVQSMLALGVLPHFLSTSLLGVVSQRLVRTLCPECRVKYDLSTTPEIFDDVKKELPPHHELAMWSPGHCDACHRQGYRSRTGVFEVMPITPKLRAAIANHADTRALNQIAVEEGMLSLRKSALLHVAYGITSVEEVFRAVPTEYLGLDDVTL